MIFCHRKRHQHSSDFWWNICRIWINILKNILSLSMWGLISNMIVHLYAMSPEYKDGKNQTSYFIKKNIINYHYVRKVNRRRGLTIKGEVVFLRLQICISDDKSLEMWIFRVSYERVNWRNVFTNPRLQWSSHRGHGLLTHVSYYIHRRRGLPTSVS